MASFSSTKVAAELQYTQDFRYSYNQKYPQGKSGDRESQLNLQLRLITQSSMKFSNGNVLNSRRKWGTIPSCMKVTIGLCCNTGSTWSIKILTYHSTVLHSFSSRVQDNALQKRNGPEWKMRWTPAPPSSHIKRMQWLVQVVTWVWRHTDTTVLRTGIPCKGMWDLSIHMTFSNHCRSHSITAKRISAFRQCSKVLSFIGNNWWSVCTLYGYKFKMPCWIRQICDSGILVILPLSRALIFPVYISATNSSMTLFTTQTRSAFKDDLPFH